MKENITGFILAGGKSSRMGTEKGLLSVQGLTMIGRVINALSPVVSELIIISNNSSFNHLGYKIIPDLVQDCGPMGGIYTALKNSKTESNFIVSCDVPFIKTELLNFIKEQHRGFDITLPRFMNKSEPLCGIYNLSCTSKFNDLLLKKEFKMQDSLQYFNTDLVEVPSKLFDEKSFMNINTEAEYLIIK